MEWDVTEEWRRLWDEVIKFGVSRMDMNPIGVKIIHSFKS
jgi:hypothetical protein